MTFGVTSLVNPVFAKLYGNEIVNVTDKTGDIIIKQFGFWIIGIFIAIILTLFLKETGHKIIKNPLIERILVIILINYFLQYL